MPAIKESTTEAAVETVAAEVRIPGQTPPDRWHSLVEPQATTTVAVVTSSSGAPFIGATTIILLELVSPPSDPLFFLSCFKRILF